MTLPNKANAADVKSAARSSLCFLRRLICDVQQRPMKLRIDRSIGNWKSEAFYRLEIKKSDEANASISLFSPFGAPISHPYWDDKVTVPMPATYNDHIGDFEV